MLPRPSAFLVKSELYKGPLRSVLNFALQIPIHRGTPDRTALQRRSRRAGRRRRARRVPGGHPRQRRSGHDPARNRLSRAATRSVPIVPVVCKGTAEALPKGKVLPRLAGADRVVFGRPFTARHPRRPAHASTIAAAAEQVRPHLLEHLDAASGTDEPPLRTSGRRRDRERCGAARRRCDRPAERRQVHARQPGARAPRGGRRGRSGRHARPGRLRGRVGRAPLHACVDTGGWQPGRPRDGRADRRQPPSSRSRRPTSSCWSSTPRWGSPRSTRQSVACCSARGARWCWPPTRSTPRAPSPTSRRCGRSGLGAPLPVSALHGRGSGDLLDAVVAGAAGRPRGRRATTAGRGGSRSIGRAERGQVQPAQPAGRHRAGARRRRGRHDAGPGRLAGRYRWNDMAICRHRGSAPSGARGDRRRVLLQPADGRRDRHRRGRPAAARRLGADQRPGPAGGRQGGRGRPGARRRDEQVGPASTRTAGSSSTARSSGSSPGSAGRPG